MVQIIQQDILTVTKGIIAHQVNCQGVIGAGLAKQIRAKYPQAYEVYMKSYRNKKLALGIISPCTIIDKHLYIYNMCGQDRYGKDGKQYTDYQALTTCLTKLHTKSLELGLTPYLPYNLGCGYGGAKWEIVYELISKHCPNAIICSIEKLSEQTVTIQEQQEPIVEQSIDNQVSNEVLDMLNQYNDSFNYDDSYSYQDYQDDDVYIPTSEDLAELSKSDKKVLDESKYHLTPNILSKFKKDGLLITKSATIHRK